MAVQRAREAQQETIWLHCCGSTEWLIQDITNESSRGARATALSGQIVYLTTPIWKVGASLCYLYNILVILLKSILFNYTFLVLLFK